ncbi:hypothetical protein Syun_000574 [Stephania yunnanensis]|uniref:Nucleoplasmin-like domain-containing protein n=1 Tax=Stephania yunnanensis TaxID=152371 RepID=A0AAP0LG86_9MAGN
MEFWGAEVKAGEPFKVEFDEKMILHLSQAALGEVKKDKANESALLYVKVGEQKLVIGTLFPDKCAHLSYDLVFEKEFELSHNWKHGSVYFCGYKTYTDEDEDHPGFSDSSDEEEELRLIENGKPEPKGEETKPSVDKAKAVVKLDSSENKPKVKVVEPKKGVDEDDSDDDDEDDSEDDDDSDDEDEMMVDGGADSEDEGRGRGQL